MERMLQPNTHKSRGRRILEMALLLHDNETSLVSSPPPSLQSPSADGLSKLISVQPDGSDFSESRSSYLPSTEDSDSDIDDPVPRKTRKKFPPSSSKKTINKGTNDEGNKGSADMESIEVMTHSDNVLKRLKEKEDSQLTLPSENPQNTGYLINRKERAKKGKADPSTWKKNKAKISRMKGEEYKGLSQKTGNKIEITREPRKIGPRCSSQACLKSKNKRKCTSISEEDRNQIFKSFWLDMNWKQRKLYVATLVNKKDVKQKTVVGESRRKCSLQYHLKVQGDLKPVCKEMFLSTLGVGEWSVSSWVKQNGERASKVKRPEKSSCLLRENIANFLDKIPKLPSHYCRSSTSRLYLEPQLSSFSEFYRMFKEHCESNNIHPIGSRDVFVQEVKERNIALFKPKKDECDLCVSHKLQNLSENEYSAHQLKKERARQEKSLDKKEADEGKCCAFTMDVQAVQLVPATQASSLYFKQKLACHNFTIYNLGDASVVCYVWHEGEGGLDANVFATCITDFLDTEIKSCDKNKEKIFYSDGCCAQNRNAVLSNALQYYAIVSGTTIMQKYLVKGHTQMECDSVHSTIERRKRNRDLYSPANYVQLIKEARSGKQGQYKVKYVHYDFFKDFSDIQYYKSIRPGNKVGEPCVTDIVALKYSPLLGIEYKLSFEDDWKLLPRRPNTVIGNTKPLYTGPSSISTQKYNDLMSLKPVIPKDYHAFYENLLHL